MPDHTLYVRDASGDFVPARPEIVVAAARTHLNRRVRRGTALTGPDLVRSFLAVTLGDRDVEYFCVICLDSQRRFLRFVELFRGTLESASVHPREVLKLALDTPQTSALLAVHNHPSSNKAFSAADEHITRVLRSGLELVGIRLLDHLLVAAGDVVSMSEQGLL